MGVEHFVKSVYVEREWEFRRLDFHLLDHLFDDLFGHLRLHSMLSRKKHTECLQL